MPGLLDILQRLTTPDYGGGLLGQSGGMGGGGLLGQGSGFGGGESPLGALSRGLLAASGPSTSRVGFGQVLGAGLQSMDEARQNNFQNLYRAAQMRSALAQGSLEGEKLTDARQERAFRMALMRQVMPGMSSAMTPDGGPGPESSPADMGGASMPPGILGQSPIAPPAPPDGLLGYSVPTSGSSYNLPAATAPGGGPMPLPAAVPSSGAPMNLPAATPASGAPSNVPAATNPLGNLDPETRTAVMWDLAMNEGKGVPALLKGKEEVIGRNMIHHGPDGSVRTIYTAPEEPDKGFMWNDANDPSKGETLIPGLAQGRGQIAAAMRGPESLYPVVDPATGQAVYATRSQAPGMRVGSRGAGAGGRVTARNAYNQSTGEQTIALVSPDGGITDQDGNDLGPDWVLASTVNPATANQGKGGGPFQGKSMDAQAWNILLKKGADRTSPEYGAAYDRLYGKPYYKPGPDGNLVPVMRTPPASIQPPVSGDGQTPALGGSAAGAPISGTAKPGGGLTAGQDRSNQEVEAARQELAGMSPAQVTSMSQQLNAKGLPNPNYNPYISTLVRKALTRKTGDDPGFQDVYSKFYHLAPDVQPGQPAGPTPQASRSVPQLPPGVTADQALQGARNALKGGAKRTDVEKRLRGYGLDPSGL